MQEDRRRRPAQQPAKCQLPTRRIEQVGAPYDEIHSLTQIVHHHGELVGPVAQPVPKQEIAALRRRLLRLRAEEPILEPFDPGTQLHPDSAAAARREPAGAASSGIGPGAELLPGAVADVDVVGRREGREVLGIDRSVVALAHRPHVGFEPQPGQVLQQRAVVCWAHPSPVVVLDPEENPSAECPGEPPHEDGVDRVTQMQVAGRSRGEAGEWRRR